MPNGGSLSLQYELEVLDELVLEKINPEQNPELSQKVSLTECIDIAKNQKEIIRKKMVSTAYSFTEEKYSITYIHNHQARLSHLIEMLTIYMDHELVKKSNDYLQVIEQILKQVVSLMQFLADTFKDFFNYDAESTVSFKKTASSYFKGQLEQLEGKIINPPSPLFELTLGPIKEFASNPFAKPTTFRRLLYYDFMIKDIELLIESGDIDPKNLKIALIGLNFNSNRFMWYMTNEIEQVIMPLEIHSEKVEKLSWYLKQINQIQMRPDIALEPNYESIKEKLINWLLEEICYLERTIKSELSNQLGKNESSCGNLEINSNVSVPQFAYLLKVIVECKVLSEKNLTQMLKFIAEHSSSPHSNGKIGYPSLRKKYYYNEIGARKAVRDIIIAMLNEVNKNL